MENAQISLSSEEQSDEDFAVDIDSFDVLVADDLSFSSDSGDDPLSGRDDDANAISQPSSNCSSTGHASILATNDDLQSDFEPLITEQIESSMTLHLDNSGLMTLPVASTDRAVAALPCSNASIDANVAAKTIDCADFQQLRNITLAICWTDSKSIPTQIKSPVFGSLDQNNGSQKPLLLSTCKHAKRAWRMNKFRPRYRCQWAHFDRKFALEYTLSLSIMLNLFLVVLIFALWTSRPSDHFEEMYRSSNAPPPAWNAKSTHAAPLAYPVQEHSERSTHSLNPSQMTPSPATPSTTTKTIHQAVNFATTFSMPTGATPLTHSMAASAHDGTPESHHEQCIQRCTSALPEHLGFEESITQYISLLLEYARARMGLLGSTDFVQNKIKWIKQMNKVAGQVAAHSIIFWTTRLNKSLLYKTLDVRSDVADCNTKKRFKLEDFYRNMCEWSDGIPKKAQKVSHQLAEKMSHMKRKLNEAILDSYKNVHQRIAYKRDALALTLYDKISDDIDDLVQQDHTAQSEDSIRSDQRNAQSKSHSSDLHFETVGQRIHAQGSKIWSTMQIFAKESHQIMKYAREKASESVLACQTKIQGGLRAAYVQP